MYSCGRMGYSLGTDLVKPVQHHHHQQGNFSIFKVFLTQEQTRKLGIILFYYFFFFSKMAKFGL